MFDFKDSHYLTIPSNTFFVCAILLVAHFYGKYSRTVFGVEGSHCKGNIGFRLTLFPQGHQGILPVVFRIYIILLLRPK